MNAFLDGVAWEGSNNFDLLRDGNTPRFLFFLFFLFVLFVHFVFVFVVVSRMVGAFLSSPSFSFCSYFTFFSPVKGKTPCFLRRRATT